MYVHELLEGSVPHPKIIGGVRTPSTPPVAEPMGTRRESKRCVIKYDIYNLTQYFHLVIREILNMPGPWSGILSPI